MGGEKKEEKKENKGLDWRSSIFFMIIGILICGVISGGLGFINVINFSVLGYSWLILSLVFGALSGFLYSITPKESRGTVFWIIISIAFVLLFITGALQTGALKGPLSKTSDFFKSSFGSVGDAFACLNPQSEKCLASIGNGGDVNQGSSDTATVSFSGNEIKGGQANTLVKIIYDNKEDTAARVTPKCSVGEDKETMQDISIQNMNPPKDGEDFLFPANKKTSTSLKCVGTVPECKVVAPCNRNLFFSLTRDAKVTGDSWRFYLNQESSPELKVDTNQPYYATIDYVGSDTVLLMPGTEIYPQVKIIRTDTKDELKKVNYLRLTFPEQVSMQCDHFLSTAGGIELRNIDLNWLDQNVKTGDNEYSFDCTLKVGSEAISVQQIIVTINSEYNVEAIFGPYLLKEAKPAA
ncbi:MAG: hypothetical protein NTX24_00095 [Candidatus Pacearchaeota archaeon]|nr:hypothetical protein [Candidatus Pacearchaeota archaeon]